MQNPIELYQPTLQLLFDEMMRRFDQSRFLEGRDETPLSEWEARIESAPHYQWPATAIQIESGAFGIELDHVNGHPYSYGIVRVAVYRVKRADGSYVEGVLTPIYEDAVKAARALREAGTKVVVDRWNGEYQEHDVMTVVYVPSNEGGE